MVKDRSIEIVNTMDLSITVGHDIKSFKAWNRQDPEEKNLQDSFCKVEEHYCQLLSNKSQKWVTSHLNVDVNLQLMNCSKNIDHQATDIVDKAHKNLVRYSIMISMRVKMDTTKNSFVL